MGESVEHVREAWRKVVETIKDGPVNVPLWEALEACVPLALEEDRLYLGLDSRDVHRAPTLQTPTAAAALENVTAKVLGQRVRLVVFPGTDERALEAEREREAARAEAARGREAAPRARAGAKDWEWLVGELQARYNAIPDKGLPWKLVEYMNDALKLVLEVETGMRAAGEEPRVSDRGLARALNRIAANVEMPLTVVAMEWVRLRGNR